MNLWNGRFLKLPSRRLNIWNECFITWLDKLTDAVRDGLRGHFTAISRLTWLEIAAVVFLLPSFVILAIVQRRPVASVQCSSSSASGPPQR